MLSETEDESQIHVPSDMLQKQCNNFFLQLLVWIMSCRTPQSMSMFAKRPSMSTVSSSGVIQPGRLHLGKSYCHASVGLQMIATR